MHRTLILTLVLLLTAPALAEPPAPMADRVKILEVEMRRGPAEDLAPYLAEDAHTLSRQYAIRALGRIGDRGKAPEMLAKLLETEESQLALALWAAGIAKTESLADPIAAHLTSEDASIVAAAVEALGWTGKKGVEADVARMLHHESEWVQASALRALGRLAPEAYLERVEVYWDSGSDEVRRAAGFACARIARARRAAALGLQPDYLGVPGKSLPLTSYSGDSLELRLLVLRANGALLPDELTETSWESAVLDAADDPDPRGAQELIRAVLSSRSGPKVDGALVKYLTHADPKVRQLAIEALGAHGKAEPLEAHARVEKDLRLRDVLAVELARCGDESFWAEIEKDPARAEMDPVFRLGTKAEVLLVSKRGEALAELVEWAKPERPGAPLPSAVFLGILWSLSEKKDPAVASGLEALTRGSAVCRDPNLHAALVHLVVAQRDYDMLHRILWPVSANRNWGPEEKRGIARSFALLAEDPDCWEITRVNARWWLRTWIGDDTEGGFVRLAARESAIALGMKDIPDEADLPANDWKGLPRPKGAVLGLDLSGEGDWLSELEILTLADRISELDPTIEFETTAGKIRLKLLPEAAPVHAASLILSVHRGLYKDTRWHRVVPSFVIQGGDPHGHGAGDAGFTIPDEISAWRFVRGTLGMPKSRKDDGGCQLFIMHSEYGRLDGNYTLYGRVTEGMDAVDRIRVGDMILDAKIVSE